VRAFLDRAAKWTPGASWTKANISSCVRAIYRAKVLFIKLNSDRGEARIWLATLRQYRDRHLSHTLIGLAPEHQAQFGYLNKLLHETFPIVERLRLGLKGESWSAEDLKGIWERHAKSFWDRVSKGFDPRILAEEMATQSQARRRD
jgi:hypothetical protein